MPRKTDLKKKKTADSYSLFRDFIIFFYYKLKHAKNILIVYYTYKFFFFVIKLRIAYLFVVGTV